MFALGIILCSLSGNHPEEYLAKSGYKSDLRYKSLINLLYLWLQTEHQQYESDLFCYFSHFWQMKPFQIISFWIIKRKNQFWVKFHQ
jgi:hypothetical protein